MALRIRSRLQDLLMRQMDRLRPASVAQVSGDVLEVGFGTGRNLSHYPSTVRSLQALDPLDELHEEVHARMRAAPFPVEHVPLPADGQLPFADETFDTVLTTWTLCSIPDAERALGEMRRVLRPGGRYVFLEHGRSEGRRTARLQDTLDPLWCRCSGGCHINRAIFELVQSAGFALEDRRRFRPRGPPLLMEMYAGLAGRGD